MTPGAEERGGSVDVGKAQIARRWAWLLLALCCAAAPAGAADAPSEYQVKAAFLQKFTNFVEWPHDVFDYDDSPLVIGILGDDPFGPILDSVVADKAVGGRRFEVRRIKRVPDAAGCHLLFISGSLESDLEELLPRIGRRGLLTVGDVDDFTSHGGIVRFYVEDNHVRFEIDVAAARRADVKISSKLLNLARVIGDAPQEERP